MSEDNTTILSSSETARYSRHILLEEIGLEGQERLKRSKALIIGAGGLGSPVALYLAAAGVGTIGIADFDTVELHNLQRQILHGTSDVDRPKIDSAKESLTEINPEIDIILHPSGVQPDNAIELFSQYDIIVDGTDNFSTRYLNNDAAYFAKKPLVYGSIFKFEGQVSLFDSQQGGPCYRCLFPSPPPPGSVPNCGEAGVIGALCGTVGSLQSLEAIKRITGAGTSLVGELLVIDTLNTSFRKLRLKRDSNCPLCGDKPEIAEIDAERYIETCPTRTDTDAETMNKDHPIEISVSDAKALLDSGEPLLIDVREVFENNICSIDGAINIPMNTIPANLDKIPKDKQVLVSCHHGGRSMNVVQFLRQNGYDNTTNVAGGIDAWAIEIEPDMQRY